MTLIGEGDGWRESLRVIYPSEDEDFSLLGPGGVNDGVSRYVVSRQMSRNLQRKAKSSA